MRARPERGHAVTPTPYTYAPVVASYTATLTVSNPRVAVLCQLPGRGRRGQFDFSGRRDRKRPARGEDGERSQPRLEPGALAPRFYNVHRVDDTTHLVETAAVLGGERSSPALPVPRPPAIRPRRQRCGATRSSAVRAARAGRTCRDRRRVPQPGARSPRDHRGRAPGPPRLPRPRQDLRDPHPFLAITTAVKPSRSDAPARCAARPPRPPARGSARGGRRAHRRG